jgi:uncharacterized protein DUF349
MTLLDRFRAQPRQRHPDAAVRLAFVQELPIDERDLLTEVAREDADARVRRAAVAKLMDAGALASVARSDPDETVRAQAIAMLRDIALEAFEGVRDEDGAAAVAALDGLQESKALSAVAKSAPNAAIAERARAAITDAHMLGSIARHAEHEAVRREAFNALRDHREILSVALNTEFREPALAAVEQITDRDELEQIAARARNKLAVKRARAILHDIDERDAREREAAAEAAAADAAAARQAESAARAADAEAAAAAEREARAESDRLAARAREEDARAAAARGSADADAEQARAQALREEADREAERGRARLAEIAEEAARAAAGDDLSAARRQLAVLRREWLDLAERAVADSETAARYREAETSVAARETTARDADQKARRTALARLQQLAARLEPIAAREELTLRAGERALRDVRAALGEIPPLPSRQDYEEIVRRLKAVQTALTPKVQELREVAGWQRWANVGIQEQLCEKMEALKALEDPEQVARHVRDLQQQWRQAADVPRAQGEQLWKRFKAAHDEVWARCEAHFAAQSEERSQNLARKVALCERAEALADSTNWIQTADEIKKLQADWKTIGAVSRGQERAVWERFRAACDKFFTRRHADLAERKKVWAANLAKKEALIARAEALAESSEWEPAAAEIKRLQGEWRMVGPVRKNRSEALWQRFRGACDRFFARYAQRHDTGRAERIAAREAVVAEIEGLADRPSDDAAGSPSDAPPADLLAKMRELRGRWQQELAARGVEPDRAAALDERFTAAFRRIVTRWSSAFAGTDLDPDTNRRRMESLVKRMEDLASSLGAPAASTADADLSPTTRLAAMLKESWAANTIGGKTDIENRLRAAQDEVRQAQAAWSRIGPVPDEARRPLADRFQQALRRISDRVGKSASPRMAGAGRY